MAFSFVILYVFCLFLFFVLSLSSFSPKGCKYLLPIFPFLVVDLVKLLRKKEYVEKNCYSDGLDVRNNPILILNKYKRLKILLSKMQIARNRHISVDPSAPTIMQHRVWSPIELWWEKDETKQKEAGLAHFKNANNLFFLRYPPTPPPKAHF